MHFTPDLYSRDLKSLVPQFVGIVGLSALKKRFSDLAERRRVSPLFEDYIKERHTVELELDRLLKHKRKTGRYPKKSESTAFQRVVGFMRMVHGVHSNLNVPGKHRLHGMIRDALKREGGFAALEHEMTTAAHCMRQGFDIEFVDLEGEDRFDLLARRDQDEIEIECKTVSNDIGRKIHRKDFIELAKNLWPLLSDYRAELRQSRLVVLKVDDRLANTSDEAKRVSETIASVLGSDNTSSQVRGFSVEVHEYRPASLPPDAATIREEIEKLIGTYQFHLFMCGDRDAVIVFVAHSSHRDQMLAYIYRQLKNATDQFSGDRPAILSVLIEDIYPDQWADLRQGSGLQVMTSKLLVSPARSHVHSVSYSSVGVLEKYPGHSSIRGTVLSYRNPHHPRYDAPSLQLY